ncbi:MAG: hypothetical protein RPS47_02035, partial [Colwellia sp.]
MTSSSAISISSGFNILPPESNADFNISNPPLVSAISLLGLRVPAVLALFSLAKLLLDAHNIRRQLPCPVVLPHLKITL